MNSNRKAFQIPRYRQRRLVLAVMNLALRPMQRQMGYANLRRARRCALKMLTRALSGVLNRALYWIWRWPAESTFRQIVELVSAERVRQGLQAVRSRTSL